MNENELPAFWPAQGNLHDGRVFVLKEDVIFTVLAQEGGISWMNARHPHSGGSFIIATAVSDEEEERATRLLKNEFALRDALQDSWAIRAVASTQYRGRFALVYAPFSFELLARRAGRAISGIARFIELAIQICTPLRQMHLQNLIHGDIKPGNIFVHHDSTCRLGSFGLSCSISGAFSQTRLAVSGGLVDHQRVCAQNAGVGGDRLGGGHADVGGVDARSSPDALALHGVGHGGHPQGIARQGNFYMRDDRLVNSRVLLRLNDNELFRGEVAGAGIVVPGDHGRAVIRGFFADKDGSTSHSCYPPKFYILYV